MTLILGIAGRKRSGKDTFARRLIEQHGFRRFAFADPLREMSIALDPIVDAVVVRGRTRSRIELVRLSDCVASNGWETAKAHPEIRRTLQRIGTEAGRDVHGEDVWVNLAMKRIAESGADLVCITDVRFPNEVRAIRDAGGRIAQIVRPSLGENLDTHPSERALDALVADYPIVNDGTVADLHTHASTVAANLSDLN